MWYANYLLYCTTWGGYIFSENQEFENSKLFWHHYFDVVMLDFTNSRNMQSFERSCWIASKVYLIFYRQFLTLLLYFNCVVSNKSYTVPLFQRLSCWRGTKWIGRTSDRIMGSPEKHCIAAEHWVITTLDRLSL